MDACLQAYLSVKSAHACRWYSRDLQSTHACGHCHVLSQSCNEACSLYATCGRHDLSQQLLPQLRRHAVPSWIDASRAYLLRTSSDLCVAPLLGRSDVSPAERGAYLWADGRSRPLATLALCSVRLTVQRRKVHENRFFCLFKRVAERDTMLALDGGRARQSRSAMMHKAGFQVKHSQAGISCRGPRMGSDVEAGRSTGCLLRR